MAKTEILSPAVRVKINNEWVELPALKGEKGDAASTIRVGEVRSGSTASVVNSGTVNDVVLDFVLPKGDRGLQGIQGPRGEQGEKGEPGPRGEKGDRGDRGLQGIQGKPGLQGERGLQGEKGEKGDRGERGLQGMKGDPLTWADLTDEQKASLKGEQGAPGPRGEQGIQGEPGPRGEQGIQGQDADSYTFEVERLWYDEAVNYTFLKGYLIVNGEKSSAYDVNGYYRKDSGDSWLRAESYNWDVSNNELLVLLSSNSQKDNIREIRLDFLKDGLVVYSHYIQIPKNGANGKDGVDGQKGADGYTPVKGVDYFDGKDGQNGNDGQDAPVFTFEVEELRYDEATKYTFLFGYLLVNGERKSDYNVEGYCRRVNQGQYSWESAQECQFDLNENKLTVLFSGSQEDNIKEIRLDFSKNGSVVYSYYLQYGKDGKTGEAATVQVGTVTEGDTVSVVNVGDEHNAILNFTLKKGKDYKIEVRDGLALVESGYNLNEARTAIGIEDLGGESFTNGSKHKYRFPILEVGDVVYFVVPYNGGYQPITFYFYLPSEGKYIVDDDARSWSNGFRKIESVYYNPETLYLSVKLQRYE